jgi:hypothetical protein
MMLFAASSIQKPKVSSTLDEELKLAIGEQPGIRGDDAAAKLQQQAAVEIEPKDTGFHFTRWVRHRDLSQSQISS